MKAKPITDAVSAAIDLKDHNFDGPCYCTQCDSNNSLLQSLPNDLQALAHEIADQYDPPPSNNFSSPLTTLWPW